jgi:methionyl-tRNA formyltransferase
MPLRLVFMGTPDFAVPSLIELAARGHDIAAVYTRAPKPAGRGMDMQVTPVEREARGLGLPVFTPLLPRWRGAAPINRAVMAGDAESGVTIMKMDEGLDTGAMAMVEHTPITMDMTAGDLHDLLAPLGADLMTRALAAAERASLTLTPQPADGVTYAEKIAKSETRIDWGKPWRQVHDHIRGLSPFPGAWFELDGVRVKALRSTRGEGSGEPGTILDDRLTIACGDGAVRLTQVQRAGKQPMVVEDFLRGTRIGAGVRAG